MTAEGRCDKMLGADDSFVVNSPHRLEDRTGSRGGMKYVTLGKSGLKGSAICLGGNSWGAGGRPAWAPFAEAESRPFFQRALDVGLTFFHTPDAYNLVASDTIMR